MSTKQQTDESRNLPGILKSPGWWIVASRELTDLWQGWRVFLLLILFCLLMGVLTFLFATDIELRLIPPKEMVFLSLQITIAVGLFIGLLIGADCISGERERATLEGLLLTPTSRRQIVVGKFLSAISPWPVILAISSPYLAILSPTGEYFGQILLWGSLVGSLLVFAFTGFAVLVSIWSNSNKTSLFVSLFFYLLFLIPTQLPGSAKAGTFGKFIQKMDPLEASNFFLMQVVVNNQSPNPMKSWLLAPLLFTTLVFALLFLLAGPGLRLNVEKGSIIRSNWNRKIALLATGFFLLFLYTQPITASQTTVSSDEKQTLQLSVDMDYKVVKTGDRIEFNTLVTYSGKGQSPPMVVAMNIINLKDGEPVDPEDWSPQRTQYIKNMTPGQSINQTWIVHAILDGDYMVYMVVIPNPLDREDTSRAVSSSGIHLTVTPFTRLNPGGVLPLVIGMPVGLTVLMSLLRWRRRRGIDNG